MSSRTFFFDWSRPPANISIPQTEHLSQKVYCLIGPKEIKIGLCNANLLSLLDFPYLGDQDLGLNLAVWVRLHHDVTFCS